MTDVAKSRKVKTREVERLISVRTDGTKWGSIRSSHTCLTIIAPRS